MSKVSEADGPLGVDNVLRRLETSGCEGWDIERAIDFAASHFYELDLDHLKRLDPFLIEGIVSSSSLRLSTEDALLDFILEVECDRPLLLRYLQLVHLSSTRMRAVLMDVRPADIDPFIWSSLCRRLVCVLPVELPMRTDKSLDGIIAYLTRKRGRNVHIAGIVMISSSPVSGVGGK
jgi:hypothetical protein